MITMNSKVQIEKDYQVVVVGGGIAGVCAAIAAARYGARTILIQNRSLLGGNGSSEVRVHIGGASEHGYHYDARESGIVEEIRLETAVRDPNNTYSWIDMVLQSWCEDEPGLDVLFNTHIHKLGLNEDGSSIEWVMGVNNGNEQVYKVFGDVFIDGTGHGTLGHLAKAKYRMGRESSKEFGESIAPEDPDNFTLGASILFRAEDMGHPITFTPPSWAKNFSDEPPPRNIPGKSGNHQRYWHNDTSGWWWVEYGGKIDAIKDNEKIRHELQAIVLGVWDYIKNHHPSKKVKEDASDFAITWIGTVPGHREFRRLIGDYILNQNDLESCKIFDDQIAVGGWSMDLHPPGGFWDTAPSASHTYMEVPYTIPYRSIYSKDLQNLLIGSRCISASHVAHGSTRLIGTLALIGQASGTAAAICIDKNCNAREILNNHLKTLQQALIKEDQWLIGVPNEDEDDLALDAKISATSEHPCCFDHVDKWIPLYFPIGQRFYLPPHSGMDEKPAISFYMRNMSDIAQEIKGGIRKDEGRLAFTSESDLARFSFEVPPGFEGWVSAMSDVKFDFTQGGAYWIYLDELDEDGVEWGMDCFQWPATKIGFYHEEKSCWKVHRTQKLQFYDTVFGPRGTMCFKIENIPSPYAATNINNGYHRPENASNLWISAPVRKNAYMCPFLLGEDLDLSRYGIDEDLDGMRISMRFKEEVDVTQIWFTFDTDLDSPFPHQDYFEMKIKDWPIHGKAPNCISKLEVHARFGGKLHKIAELKDNYQRRVKIKLDATIHTKELVIIPTRNWGFHCFGIYEIRVY